MPERKIAPSEALTKAVETLLEGEAREIEGSALLSRLAQLGAKQLIQEALEKEQAEHLERGRYERRKEGAPALYRNGYESGRMLIGEGETRAAEAAGARRQRAVPEPALGAALLAQ